jgi:hypothetical protein
VKEINLSFLDSQVHDQVRSAGAGPPETYSEMVRYDPGLLWPLAVSLKAAPVKELVTEAWLQQ